MEPYKRTIHLLWQHAGRKHAVHYKPNQSIALLYRNFVFIASVHGISVINFPGASSPNGNG